MRYYAISISSKVYNIMLSAIALISLAYAVALIVQYCFAYCMPMLCAG
jgi:hypothetical protein